MEAAEAEAVSQRGGGGRRVMDDNANHVFETSKGVEPILSFEAMGIKEDLLRGIYNYGFEKPSAIQQRAVFPIISGCDVISQAHSGTGKTSMIALAVSQIVDTKSSEVQALILAPTRELATQTERLILAIGGYINVRAHACVGGESLGEDIRKLEDGVHVISGTPGLVCDMIKRRTLRTRAIKILILDESNEMLSKGFKDQIYDVYRYLPPELQVVLISTTLSNDILEMSSKFMTDPVRILVKRDELTLEQLPPTRARPKRFVKNQIPDSILHDAALNATIAILPANYNFEIHKIIWRVRSANATRVALQFPEGLLMYSLVISDILIAFAGVTHCFILGDVTYGACCVDDLSSRALDAHLLVHFGHSCLVPIDTTTVPVLYIFVEIAINTRKLLQELNHNFNPDEISNFIMAGTIQFSNAIRAVKPELENVGFRVLVPQSKPLSAGEVLGCTAPSVKLQVCSGKEDVIIFVADGRFHLEAFMIANPLLKAFRYDPYIGKLFLEEYDHEGMKKDRKKAIERAVGAKSWGIVLGTLGRQGNPIMVERLERKMQDKGLDYMVVLISELSPNKIELFGDAVDAWVQVACPRLSIDWGDAFKKPLLTSFEAEIALGDRPGWWERKLRVNGSSQCMMKEDCCANGSEETSVDYPMDYYAQDGGEWNSCYSKKASRYRGKSNQCCSNNGCEKSIK